METKDITKAVFQSPHIAVRYYIMFTKLTAMVEQGHNHPILKEFNRTLSLPGIKVEFQTNKKCQVLQVSFAVIEQTLSTLDKE